jgi:hypothetical protein
VGHGAGLNVAENIELLLQTGKEPQDVQSVSSDFTDRVMGLCVSTAAHFYLCVDPNVGRLLLNG